MGTRGLFGLRKGGVDKTTYNHYDSYPDGLGYEMADFIINHSADNMLELYDKIEMVDECVSPTTEQIMLCREYADPDFSVSEQSAYDWYCLTRGLQGNLAKAYKMVSQCGVTYMMDRRDFIRDSLFCEYAYIINLDDRVLELYTGFQRKLQEGNRYGTAPNEGGYYPCKLLDRIPFSEITNIRATIDRMNEALEKECGDEDV